MYRWLVSAILVLSASAAAVTARQWVVLLPLFLPVALCLPGAALGEAPDTRLTITIPQKQQIISERLVFYNNAFPDIRFLHVTGGKNWWEELAALLSLFGNRPINLDYEHPAELAADVMEVSLHRLALMMEHGVVSASMYRIGEGASTERPNLCLITLDPEHYIENSMETTGYMLGLSDEFIERVHRTRLLDTRDHLRFTLDHEAYHCLDSYFHGGAPRTRKPLGGEHNTHVRESAADAFALAMRLADSKISRYYARNITHVRALWLFSDSHNRCTFESMVAVYRMKPAKLRTMTLRQLVTQARTIALATVGNYDEYVYQWAEGFHAAKRLGLEPRLYGDQRQVLRQVEIDPDHIDYKVRLHRYYLGKLFNDEPLEFYAAEPGRKHESNHDPYHLSPLP